MTDDTPCRVFVRNNQGLLVCDGLTYHSVKVATKQVGAIKRTLGFDAEVRPI